MSDELIGTVKEVNDDGTAIVSLNRNGLELLMENDGKLKAAKKDGRIEVWGYWDVDTDD